MVKALTTGLTVNLVGLGATIVGLQATTGLLFAKTLTIAATGPFAQNANPVLGVGYFLGSSGEQRVLAHWLGMSISLWLLRTVNLPSPPRAERGEVSVHQSKGYMILNEDDVLLFNIFLLQFLAFYILFSTERDLKCTHIPAAQRRMMLTYYCDYYYLLVVYMLYI